MPLNPIRLPQVASCLQSVVTEVREMLHAKWHHRAFTGWVECAHRTIVKKKDGSLQIMCIASSTTTQRLIGARPTTIHSCGLNLDRLKESNTKPGPTVVSCHKCRQCCPKWQRNRVHRGKEGGVTFDLRTCNKSAVPC